MRTGPVKRLHPSTDLDGQWVSESSPLRIESGQHEELRVDAHTMSQAQYHHVVARDRQTDDVSSSATDCPPRLLGRQPCDTPTDLHVHILRSRAPTHPVGEAAVLRPPGGVFLFSPLRDRTSFCRTVSRGCPGRRRTPRRQAAAAASGRPTLRFRAAA